MGGLLMKRWGHGVNSGGTITDPVFSNTKLLLGFNGADGATATSDESAAARGAATFFGNAQLDTAQQKFGSASLLLDGTDDGLSYADSADWLFPDGTAFTIEAWIRFNSVAGFQTIVSQWNESGNNRGWLFDFSGGNTLRFAYSTNGTNVIAVQGTWSPSTNTWYHVAVDRGTDNGLRLYANGSIIGTVTTASGFTDSTSLLRIGCINSNIAPDNEFNGWLDEVRITKGTARYNSDSGYSVPTVAFPRS